MGVKMIQIDRLQIAILLVFATFYVVYFGKMLLQRRQGVRTNQMSKGNKPRRTLAIERLLSLATLLIVPVELISIALNTRLLPAAGISIAALGVCAFIAAVFTMRESWRAGIPAEDKTALVTGGIYRVSRNPAFLGFDLMYVGTLVAYFNWVHLAFCALAVVMMHLQILEEERFLAHAFGQAYEEYKRRAARYFLFF